MSYDLAVFEPRDELRSRTTFDAWYDETTDWDDKVDYNDPNNARGALRAWFDEMIQTFPPMNGPLALSIEQLSRGAAAADYGIARDLIYLGFSWSQVELAYETCFALAEKHGVGFLDASGDEGAAWFPGANGQLQIVHRHGDS